MVNAIVLVMEVEDFRRFGLSSLEEGMWRDAGVGDYWFRLDPPNPAIGVLRHIHIAHRRHLSSTDMQVAWNVTGTRHDADRFNTAFIGFNQARDIARKVLKLSSDVVLEEVPVSDRVAQLVESARHWGGARRIRPRGRNVASYSWGELIVLDRSIS